MNDRPADLARFYRSFARLEQMPGQGFRLADLPGPKSLPARGVYFFKEPGQLLSGSDTGRIVRVGTHAVSAGSRATLNARLRAHMGTRAGGGNHRGSIFRLHLGRA